MRCWSPGRLLLAAWAAGSVGVALRDGEFSLAALALVLLALVAVAAAAWRGGALALTAVAGRELAPVAFVVVSAAAVLRPDRLLHAGPRTGLVQLLFLATAATGALALLAARHDRVGVRVRVGVALGLALGLAALTGVVTVVVVDDPDIDVWYLLQQSSDGLARGQDMYQQHWARSDGLRDVYPYLPGTTLLLAPSRWALGDVRYALLLAGLLAVVVGFRLAGRYGGVAAPVPLLLVMQPKWPILVGQSWTEPLLLLALGTALVALREGRGWLAVVALAVALAAKQHVVLLVPLFALWPGVGWRRAAGSCALAGAVVLPWVVWAPGDFWRDAVEANLALPVIERALCLPALLARLGVTTSFALTLLALVAAYALVLRRVRRDPAGLALGCALVLLTLAVFNKQSFYNHYTLALGLLVLALSAAAPPPDRARPPARLAQRGAMPTGLAQRRVVPRGGWRCTAIPKR